MSLLNTGLNALGTLATLKSLFGKKQSGPTGRYNSFLTEIRNSSVSRTNLFDVMIPFPKIMQGDEKSTATVQKISLFAEGAQLPAISIQTDDSIKRFGIGPTENVPYSMQFNDITLNFIGDGAGEIYKFFYGWMHGIVNGDGQINSSRQSSATGLAPYEVEFKENYKADIDITTYNEQNDKILEYRLYNAFPKIVPDVSLSWKDTDGYMQFGITFCFMHAELLNVKQPFQGSSNTNIGKLSTLQKLVKLTTAVQALRTIRKPRSIQDALASSTTLSNASGIFR
jgi:hypothetical protein